VPEHDVSQAITVARRAIASFIATATLNNFIDQSSESEKNALECQCFDAPQRYGRP